MINGFSKSYYDNKCRKLKNRDNTVVDKYLNFKHVAIFVWLYSPICVRPGRKPR